MAPSREEEEQKDNKVCQRKDGVALSVEEEEELSGGEQLSSRNGK